MTPVERDELRTLLGLTGATERFVASNMKLRVQSAEILTDLFEQLAPTMHTKPMRRFWHVSFLGPLINEYRPEMDVDAYRQVVDRLLRSKQLNAVFSIELQALTNYPQRGFGRSFLLNAHALVWTDDTAFDPEAAEEDLAASRALHNEFGADTVVFRKRDDEAGVIYLAHYLTKVPLTGKRRRKDPLRKGRWQLFPVRRVRGDLQLRLIEVLSQLEVTDLVWGVNEGTRIRKSWKAALTAWNKRRCAVHSKLEKDFDIGDLWRTLRSRPMNGSRLYRPPVFYGPRPRPRISEGRLRHGGKRIWPDKAKVRFELEPAPPGRISRDLDDALDILSQPSTWLDDDDLGEL